MVLVSIWILLSVFAPEPYQEAPARNQGYSMDTMQSAVDWHTVRKIQSDLAAMGSRFMGQPGMYAAEDYIRNLFSSLGLELHEQENWTLVPKTVFREIYLADASARRLDDVQIYPFMPNHLQPIATPDDGVAGELVLLTQEALFKRDSFEGCIGLLDVSDGRVPDEYGYDWTRYAQLGLQGLIVAHPDGLERVPWHRVAADTQGMVSSVPVNFPRLAADGAIFRYVGQRVRLRVKVRFEEVRNTTLVGVLRAGGTSQDAPNQSALFVLANYDACSILPDKAPGVLQALWPATSLALAQGLAPYRNSLVRDVVFVAFGAQMMAHDGDDNLLRVLDENISRQEKNPITKLLRTISSDPGALAHPTQEDDGKRLLDVAASRIRPWEEREASNAAKLAMVDSVLRCFDSAAFLSENGPTTAALQSLDTATRQFVKEQVKYTLQSSLFELSEPVLQAKLAALRAGETNPEQPLLSRFLKLKASYDQLAVVAGYSIDSLLGGAERTRALLEKHQFRDRCKERLLELRAYHERQARCLAKDVDVIKALAPYQNVLVFDNAVMPAYQSAQDSPSVIEADSGAGDKETLSFSNGFWEVFNQMRSVVSLMAAARQRLKEVPGQEAIEENLTIPPLDKLHHVEVSRYTRPMPDWPTNMWTQFGYLTFKFINFDRSQSYQHFADPVDLPYMRNVASLKHSLAVIGETLLALAHGDGQFPPIQVRWLKRDFSGRVLASGIGQSMMPDYPLKNAVLGSRPLDGNEYARPGHYEHLLIATDPYGAYELVNSASDFWVARYVWDNGYSPVAAWHDETGRIAWMKDEGEDGQRLYKSVNLDWFKGDTKRITVVTFRAAPVVFLDTTNPQSMQAYADVKLMDRDGLSTFRKQCMFRSLGVYAHYIEPTKRFYATMESGATRNELAKVIRGFLIGAPESRGDTEINGEGFLAADTPIMNHMPRETAASMLHLNGKRLELQDRRNMADAQTKAFYEKGLTLLKDSEDPAQPQHEADREAREAATYAMLSHPVLRETVVEAVMGILWYLALLVPFLYFFEKLVFCFSDVRKQIAVQAVVFLIVFGLLRILHPAFEMVRSSLMILLGFVIVLISGGMSVLFSSKFSESIEELRKKRGRVDAAEVNRLGVMGSAFMLGLNNMHRRKMRTWLTCGTLTLITFALISFTSINSDIVDEATAIGKAPYQGILLKHENFKRFKDAEVFALRTLYSDRWSGVQARQVSVRRMYLGIQNWEDKRGRNPELEMSLRTAAGVRKVTFSSALQLGYAEPLQPQIRMLTNTPWFSEEDEKNTGKTCPVFIPDAMAESLGIGAAAVNAGPVEVTINGRAFLVRGIFDSESLGNAVDLDGSNILPYDVESMARVQQEDNVVIAQDSDPRMPPRNVIIAPSRDLEIQAPNSDNAVTSVALVMSQGTFKEVNAAIASFLERSGKPAYYGLDGVAYRGQRTRQTSFAGLIDLIVPLLIAALSVLNAMRGSVYERRDEIEVYNAVGIAPRYVFLIFFAEAFVYAVVGSVLGYILSQGVGRVLTGLDMTGGLNMTYTSIGTIYASLAVAATVCISTYFPARSAMNIAKPAEEAGWSLPEPEDDRLAFDLPFTFDYRDRMAVLTFVDRLLLDHGEGGAGRFTADTPVISVRIHETPGAREAVPVLRSTIWIKPFDLGVSQTLDVAMMIDEETREFKARVAIERLSGTREAWLRLNHGFVAELRRHFLHWRAVPAKDRDAMFQEITQRMAVMFPEASV
jgi:hypothetical protein